MCGGTAAPVVGRKVKKSAADCCATENGPAPAANVNELRFMPPRFMVFADCAVPVSTTAVFGLEAGGTLPCQLGPMLHRLLDPRPDQVKVCWASAGTAAASRARTATKPRRMKVTGCMAAAG